MPVVDTPRAITPGEQYIKALWRGRWLFLAIVAAFVAGSVLVTALLPKTFTSEAIVSIRQAPQLEPVGTLYNNTAIVGGSGFNAEAAESAARRTVRRLRTNSVVTAAARDVGVIEPSDIVDERLIRKWITVDDVERTDLVSLTVSQGTAESAQKFAKALLARAMEAIRAEAAADPTTREFLEREKHRALAALTQAEADVLKANASSGPEREMAVSRAKLELDLAKDQYAAVRRRLGMLDLIVANTQFHLVVVDPPTFPLRQSFPRPLLNASIGLILGILAATTFISLRSVLQGA
jgi:uncharacterized protein involved in exopolysaccharide biosynthesis